MRRRAFQQFSKVTTDVQGTPTTSSVKCRGRRPARREHSSTQREIATVHHQGLVREVPAPDAPPPDTPARVRRRRIEPNAHAHRAPARHPRRRRAHRGRGADVRRLPPALLSQGAAPVASLFPSRSRDRFFARDGALTSSLPSHVAGRLLRHRRVQLRGANVPRVQGRGVLHAGDRDGVRSEPFPGTLAFRDYPPPTCRDTCRRSADPSPARSGRRAPPRRDRRAVPSPRTPRDRSRAAPPARTRSPPRPSADSGGRRAPGTTRRQRREKPFLPDPPPPSNPKFRPRVVFFRLSRLSSADLESSSLAPPPAGSATNRRGTCTPTTPPPPAAAP